VDDARAGLLLSPGSDAEQRVHERSRLPPGSRVHGETGGLVHDEEMLVLVGEPERDLLAFERPSSLRLDLELVPGREAVALEARGAADGDLAGLDQPLGGRPRPDLGQLGEEAVEPRPGRGLRNAESDGQDGPERRERPAARGRRRR
jgi:hypothetical protein